MHSVLPKYRCSALFPSFGVLFTPLEDTNITDLPLPEIQKELQQHGLVLFSGFEINDETFVQFSESLTPNMQRHGVGRRKKVSVDGTITEVVNGTARVLLHRELGYTPFPPDLLWFYCKRPAEDAGETTVADPGEIYENMSEAAKDLLHRHEIIYHHSWSEAVWQSFLSPQYDDAIAHLRTYPNVQVLSASSPQLLRFSYQISAFQACPKTGKPLFLNSMMNVYDTRHHGQCELSLDSGEPLPDWLILELGELELRFTHKIKWKATDVVVLDNHRLMHGRMGFSGPRTIYTRFGRVS